MKRFSEQLHTKSQTVKLKKSEQADLRERIVSYMEYHPLPASMKVAAVPTTKKATRSNILTESFAQYAIPYQMLFKWGGVAAVFVLVFIPFMAERTVPGDTLYAVKVQFNEEVRSTLTWGSYEKVEWETTRLNRRIAEARLLADEGLLTEEVEASVAAAVQVHSDNAKREIEVLRASDADEATIATIAFESSLTVQSQSFADESATGTARSGMLISDVIDKSRADMPASASSSVPAYEKLMARVELSTTRVRDLRDALGDTVSEKELADVTRRIDDIDRAILEAIELAADEATEIDARLALADVIARTQKLIVFMTELQLREEVTIDEVVPVVPTLDEMVIDRSKRATELTAAISKITAAITTLENPALAEKLIDSLERLESAQVQLATITDYKEFVTQSNEALAVAKDGLLLIEQAGVVVPDAVDPVVVDTSTSTATSSDAVTATSSTSIASSTASSTTTTTNEQGEFDELQ